MVSSHPVSVCRRSRAASRMDSRSAESSSQHRRAAASEVASSGGTSRPGRAPPTPRPSASGTPPTLGRDDREPAGQRLGDDHAVGLRPRRQHEHVGSGVRRVEGAAGPGTGEADPAGEARVVGVGPEAIDEARVELQRADAGAQPRQVRDLGQGVDQQVVPLGRHDRPDAEQLAAGRRSRRQRGGSAPGLGDVDPVRPAASSARGPSSRVHWLVVTTDATLESTARSRGRPWSEPRPSGMCSSTTSWSRSASGITTSGAADATRPSMTTSAPSGIWARTSARPIRAPTAAHGQLPGTPCSWSDQPSAASPSQTRRS